MIVLDCSVVVDVLAGAPGTDDLRSRLAAEELHAPTLLDYELVSAVRGINLAGALTDERAGDLLEDFDDLPIHRWPSAAALRRRAFVLRHDLSAYDAAYVALAESLECPLLTRDTRLARTRGHDAQIALH